MYCFNCGHKLEDGVRFCEKCGIPVGAAPAEEQPAEEVSPVAEPVAAEFVATEPVAETPAADAQTPEPPSAPQYIPPQYAAPQAAPAREGSAVWSILSLIGGIFSTVFFWIPILMFVPEILSAVFGIVGLVKRSCKGMAIAGLILSIIAFLLTCLVSMVVIVLLVFEGGLFDSPYYFGN